jgi:hypothetical protein
MMSLHDYAAICLKVLADWRVLAVAAGTIALWAILRFVGMVYRRRPRVPVQRSKPIVKEPTRRAAVRRQAGPASDEEMVE